MYSTTNSKLKKDNIYSFNLPAIKTCPQAKDCVKFCYACQGCYVFPCVKTKRLDNYNFSLSKDFIKVMVLELKKLIKKGVKAYRLHDSGDFYSMEYAKAWNTIAKQVPELTIYAYTKSISIAKAIDWYSNVVIRYSFGGYEDNLIDVNKDIHAKVFLSLKELKQAGYTNGGDRDIHAFNKNIKKLGLVYHGTKKINSLKADKDYKKAA